MNTHLRVLCLGALLAGVLAVGCSIDANKHAAWAASPAPPTANAKLLGTSVDKFGYDLLGRLRLATPVQNVFISPLSISEALSMAANGARGDTQQQIRSVLRFPDLGLSDINDANANLLSTMESADAHATVSIANAIWSDKGADFAPEFANSCEAYYQAQARSLDFASPSAANTINSWVNTHTQGMIPTLVDSRDLTPGGAVLTNAIYFHATWASEFQKSDTAAAPFYELNDSKKSVQMMHQQTRFSYYRGDNYAVVQLPYGDGTRLSMYVVLPDKGATMANVVGGLNENSFAQMTGSMQSRLVELQLPRFQIDYSAVLNGPLADLGMPIAFTGGADFSGMGRQSYYISKVIHKSVLKVDEQGTTAAAATGIMMPGAVSAMPPVPVPFIVDHPFFCVIRDDATGADLFMGIIEDPQEL